MTEQGDLHRVGVDAGTVTTWRRRFAAHGLDGLRDEPRSGAPRQIGDGEIAETIRRTLGQLRDAQDRIDPSLDGQAAALARPLRADERLLDQPGRTLFRAADRQKD